MAAALLSALVAVPQSAHAAGTCYPVSSHFAGEYYANPANWGCATSPEYRYLNGSFQEFTKGEMVWSPSQGTNMVVSARRYGTPQQGFLFHWGPSDPYNYDAWLTRVTYNGNLLFQKECTAGVWGSGCGRTIGGLYVPYAGKGHYRIITEGCDVSWTGSHTCRQGWTIPVDIFL
ncbi:hypothetical protein AB0H94_35070 [Streptomyces purpurascens]|uniref:hypothetical protein n=1 Tax=Streptomyces purpurascens TaxID=1924 RepID=UPI0033DD677A